MMKNVLLILFAALSGVAASLGVGGGGILILFLSFFGISQIASQGINLIFFLPIALVSIIIYSKKGKVDFKLAGKIALFGAIGTFAGAYTASIMGNKLLRKAFAVFLLALAAKQVFEIIKSRQQNDG